MGLLKWQEEDLFPSYGNFPKIFNSYLSDVGTNFESVPSVNIKEKDDKYMLEVAAPGMNKDEFDVAVDNNVLTITGNKEEEKKEEGENEKWTRREFSYTSFKRSFQLPETIHAEKIDAEYKDGVLCISIPKKEEAKVKEAKRIKIK